jgi:hypothetical protein
VPYRCGHQALFLPDFIEKAVVDHVCGATTRQQLLLAINDQIQDTHAPVLLLTAVCGKGNR